MGMYVYNCIREQYSYMYPIQRSQRIHNEFILHVSYIMDRNIRHPHNAYRRQRLLTFWQKGFGNLKLKTKQFIFQGNLYTYLQRFIVKLQRIVNPVQVLKQQQSKSCTKRTRRKIMKFHYFSAFPFFLSLSFVFQSICFVFISFEHLQKTTIERREQFD